MHPGEVSSRQIKNGCAICELHALIVLYDGTASQMFPETGELSKGSYVKDSNRLHGNNY